MKILSYNLRYCDDPDGHSIAERAPRVLDIIQDYDPDICGFQEVTPPWMEQLAALDDRFDHLLVYRAEKSQEGTPIFWRKDRYDLVDSSYFWLSPTPEVPSKGWSGGFGCYRICCFVSLKNKETGKVFHYFNTHFDGSWESDRGSAKLIISRAIALGKGEHVACTADFNFSPADHGYHAMRSFFNEVREELAPDSKQATLNCYKEVGEKPEWIIDHCFYQGRGLKPTGYEVITRLYDGKYPSDHYGVLFQFECE